jgi:diaminopimelate epimerase
MTTTPRKRFAQNAARFRGGLEEKTLRALKGHGTENDFIVIPDLDGRLDLNGAAVRALCDRRAGIGADGLLRAVRPEHETAWADRSADFAMDFRNADGSVGEMCGNGVRVFAAYLQRAGLLRSGQARIATRGGVRTVTVAGPGTFTVGMGAPRVHPDLIKVRAGGLVVTGTPVDMPNPHVVVAVSPEQLAAVDLTEPPVVEPEGPAGQNVEFVTREGAHRARMRVHERGVGETRSCGTGICAVVAVLAEDRGRWQVAVPGGECAVRWTDDGGLQLTGPAVIVAEMDIDTVALTGAGTLPR